MEWTIGKIQETKTESISERRYIGSIGPKQRILRKLLGSSTRLRERIRQLPQEGIQTQTIPQEIQKNISKPKIFTETRIHTQKATLLALVAEEKERELQLQKAWLQQQILAYDNNFINYPSCHTDEEEENANAGIFGRAMIERVETTDDSTSEDDFQQGRKRSFLMNR